MATSTSMKTSLVLMLLLSALVASHAHQVSFKNTCKKPIKVNDVWIGEGITIVLEIKVKLIIIEVFDIHNVKHTAKYKCGDDVVALIFYYEKGFLKVKVAALSLIGGLLQTALGLVSNVLQVVL